MNFPAGTSKFASSSEAEIHSDPIFTWPVRVYWEDTDAGGVVYHASYVRFLERARSEWLRARGVAQARVHEAHGILFVVAEMNLRFLAPASACCAVCATTPKCGPAARLPCL